MSSMTTDARIPVLLGGVTQADGSCAGIAWLVADDVVVPSETLARTGTHAAGCACCRPRGAAADALRRLFLRRARGEVAFFHHVVAVGDTAFLAAVAAALVEDLFVAARFRAAPGL